MSINVSDIIVPDVSVSFDVLCKLHAKASTTAFLLWILIRQKMEDDEDVGFYELSSACSAAILTQQLHDLLGIEQ